MIQRLRKSAIFYLNLNWSLAISRKVIFLSKTHMFSSSKRLSFFNLFYFVGSCEVNKCFWTGTALQIALLLRVASLSMMTFSLFWRLKSSQLQKRQSTKFIFPHVLVALVNPNLIFFFHCRILRFTILSYRLFEAIFECKKMHNGLKRQSLLGTGFSSGFFYSLDLEVLMICIFWCMVKHCISSTGWHDA